MSDLEWIERGVASGALIRMPSPPGGRRLFVKERVWLQLDGSAKEGALTVLDQARCVAKLEDFAAGVPFTASMMPFAKSRETDLALTDAPEESSRGIWTIRLHHDRPFFRIFGAFAERDCFIVLGLKNRDDIEDFNREVWRAAREWDRIPGVTGRLLEGTLNGHASKCIEAPSGPRRPGA